MSSVTWMMTTGIAFGRMWRKMRRSGGIPQAAASSDEVSLPDRQHLGPDEAGVPGPETVERAIIVCRETAAEGGGNGDGEDEGRKRQEHVRDAHQDLVGQSAKVAGDCADDRTEDHREDQHDERDLERDPRSDDDAAEDVATEFVRAERMAEGRREQLGASDVLGVGIRGGQLNAPLVEEADEREDEEGRDDDRPHQVEPIADQDAAQVSAQLAPVGRGLCSSSVR
jgi:hypothetical protein